MADRQEMIDRFADFSKLEKRTYFDLERMILKDRKKALAQIESLRRVDPLRASAFEKVSQEIPDIMTKNTFRLFKGKRRYNFDDDYTPMSADEEYGGTQRDEDMYPIGGKHPGNAPPDRRTPEARQRQEEFENYRFYGGPAPSWFKRPNYEFNKMQWAFFNKMKKMDCFERFQFIEQYRRKAREFPHIYRELRGVLFQKRIWNDEWVEILEWNKNQESIKKRMKK